MWANFISHRPKGDISQFSQGNYFTFGVSRIFHLKSYLNYDIITKEIKVDLMFVFTSLTHLLVAFRQQKSPRFYALGFSVDAALWAETSVQVAERLYGFRFPATVGRGVQLDAELARRGSESLTPCQQKKRFCLPTKVLFLNDVCRSSQSELHGK